MRQYHIPLHSLHVRSHSLNPCCFSAIYYLLIKSRSSLTPFLELPSNCLHRSIRNRLESHSRELVWLSEYNLHATFMSLSSLRFCNQKFNTSIRSIYKRIKGTQCTPLPLEHALNHLRAVVIGFARDHIFYVELIVQEQDFSFL